MSLVNAVSLETSETLVIVRLTEAGAQWVAAEEVAQLLLMPAEEVPTAVCKQILSFICLNTKVFMYFMQRNMFIQISDLLKAPSTKIWAR